MRVPEPTTSPEAAGPAPPTGGRPVLAYLAGAYGWAWALWAYWIPNMGPAGLEISGPFLACAIGGGFGPSLAALLLAAVRGGKAGVLDLLGGLGRYRAGLIWYGFALLAVPLMTVVSLALQSRFVGPLHWGAGGPPVALGIVWPLLAALGEELGWRGWMLPRLVPKFGLLGAALLVGIAWGCWHLPADYIGLKGYGNWFWPAFVLQGPLLLTAHAVIMAWLWRRSDGSLLLMVLYHASITGSAILAPSAADMGGPAVAAAAIGAAVTWIAALSIIVLRRVDFRAGD